MSIKAPFGPSGLTNRSPTKKTGSCGLCNNKDNLKMVQCDKCDSWYHFVCVNVTSEIAKQPWDCEKCKTTNMSQKEFTESPSSQVNNTLSEVIITNEKENDNKSVKTKSHTSSRKSQRKRELALKKLEEERLLQQQYIDKKYQILEDNSDTDNDDDFAEANASVKSLAKVSDWLSNTDPLNNLSVPVSVAPDTKLKLHKTTQLTEHSNPAEIKKRQLLNFDNVPQVHTNAAPFNNSHLHYTGTLPKLFQSTNAPNTFQPKNQIDKHRAEISSSDYVIAPIYSSSNLQQSCIQNINPRNSAAIKYQEHPLSMQSTYANVKPISSCADMPLQRDKHEEPQMQRPTSDYTVNANPLQADNEPLLVTALSAQHLAARHAMPKELPSFTGRCEEWPLFISAYETSTRTCNFTNDENLVRLQRSLKGKALESVRSRLLLPSNVSGIIETLRMLFGRPELIINTLLQKIRKEPPPRAEKLETIIQFALSVQNICATMEASNMTSYLWNPSLIQELTEKLPAQIKLNWALHKRTLQHVTLASLSSWLTEIAYAASDVTIFTDFNQYSEAEFKSERRAPKNNLSLLNAHIEEPVSHNNNSSKDSFHITKSTDREKSCLICKQNCPSVKDCNKFISLDLTAKWSAVRDLKLCRRCLNPHGRFACKSKNICGKNNCEFKHHKLLHNDKKDEVTKQQNDENIVVATQLNCNTHQATKSSILFRIVPVVVSNRDVTIKTYAFLDDGSSITLVEKDLANELGLTGTPDPICLKWTGDTHRTESQSKSVSFHISAIGNNARSYKIAGAHTISLLDLPTQSISVSNLTEQYQHLKGIPIDSYEKGTPRLLIGLDNLHLQLPLKVKEGTALQPVGAKTRIGWAVYGPCMHEESGSAHVNNEYHSFHICECNPDNELNRIVKEYFSLENMGVTKQTTFLESSDDKRARAILESSTVKTGSHYELGLLWKYDQIHLPNSFPMARRRYDCLQKRLFKEPDLAKILDQQIQDYVSKGYARKLTQTELQKHYDRVWYLPTFPVINPNKPGKVRIVWDAAAKSNGVSLNDMLLKGPDQLASLLAVLLRFRERKVAICADISEMFHQVGINKADQHSQRFMWRNKNEAGDPDIYVMQVMTFGATCSPSCAQYVMKKNAMEFTNKFPRAVTAITTNHYVDDLLDCTDTEDEAIQLAKEVFDIHSHAGFHIRNWISNSSAVIRALGENNLASKKSLNVSSEVEAEKVLGMWWSTETDTFTYSLAFNKSNEEYLSGIRRPTKREVLRTMMTIFDPLGLLAFYLVYVKILLQDIWRSPIEWDDELTDLQNEKWQIWIRLLPNVRNVRVPRCYLRESQGYESTELHIFADASEEACAAVVYLRTVNNNIIQCALVGAKTKVAPIKPISIPRLELEAATLAARLATTIGKALTVPINQRFFWIDSNVVKCWLNSDQKKYRQFVAFRIGEILETSEVSEWNWLPSKINVADDATKWQKTPDFSTKSRWFNGPSFLYTPEDKWKKNEIICESTSEEIRPQYIFHIKHITKLFDVSRFSNWRRLLRVVGYVYRVFFNLKAVTKGHAKRVGPITQEEMKKAENLIYRQSQLDSYPDEMAILLKNKDSGGNMALDKSSALYKHCPQLDDEDVIRAWGRIDAADGITADTKRPILLAANHPVTRLIISHFHRRFHHHNHETVINELRQVYSIPRLRVALKNVRNICQLCRNQSASPQIPRMAELPACRLSTFTRPFSYIGIDYFGPMTVSVGRRTEKRWGMLVTCLTVRAIHIEVAHSLSTDSCILCLRNFIARRGTPTEIYCDNGTNFRGADRELQAAVREINNEKMMENFETPTTKWIFNPPAAPHMGGSWERLVRSVKTTLHQIQPTRNPTDELLQSMLLEVENIVNSRPLTYIPIDDANDESLTPNHFLLGSSCGSKPIGIFDDDKILMKKNYMKSQQYACHFWKRWIREYLPSLTRRTKWYQPAKPLAEGDIVIIVDENNPRNCWPKGRIIKSFPGKDGQVRRVIVKTSSGVYERPASKIAALDVVKDESKPFITNDLPGGSVANAPNEHHPVAP